jgi:hypothetical protein
MTPHDGATASRKRPLSARGAGRGEGGADEPRCHLHELLHGLCRRWPPVTTRQEEGRRRQLGLGAPPESPLESNTLLVSSIGL